MPICRLPLCPDGAATVKPVRLYLRLTMPGFLTGQGFHLGLSLGLITTVKRIKQEIQLALDDGWFPL